MHISLDAYILVLRGHLSAEQLLWLAHEHLMEVCSPCAVEHAASEEGGAPGDVPDGVDLPLPDPPVAPAGDIPRLPSDARLIGRQDLEKRLARLERIRYLRDLARRHLAHLLKEPPHAWPLQVASARSRYRSRAFAELLIEESRRRVSNEPAMARALAALVHEVLRWLPGAEGRPWAVELAIRARAWEANALRVAGDLQAADRLFANLRIHPERDSALRPWARAEIASLEASLRIDQGLFETAERLLLQAKDGFGKAGDEASGARVLIKLAGLLFHLGRPEEALGAFDTAVTAHADVELETHLWRCLLHGKTACLTTLGRYAEAEELVTSERELLETAEPRGAGLLLHHRGRIALGLERHDEAESALVQAREKFLSCERLYDAVLVSLDLAQVYLEAGRLDELEELAAELVPQFQARGVARETLAALHLLAKAAAARRVTGELLTRLRGRLQAGRCGPSG